ncbi:hypothetical protein FNZ23_30160, partial [Streptomyces benahoarensis]
FSRTPGAVRRPPAQPGADTAEIARDWAVPGLLDDVQDVPPPIPGADRDRPFPGASPRHAGGPLTAAARPFVAHRNSAPRRARTP